MHIVYRYDVMDTYSADYTKNTYSVYSYKTWKLHKKTGHVIAHVAYM